MFFSGVDKWKRVLLGGAVDAWTLYLNVSFCFVRFDSRGFPGQLEFVCVKQLKTPGQISHKKRICTSRCFFFWRGGRGRLIWESCQNHDLQAPGDKNSARIYIYIRRPKEIRPWIIAWLNSFKCWPFPSSDFICIPLLNPCSLFQFDNVNSCLHVLRSQSVGGLENITTNDICAGRLKAVLALFFALSRFKQQAKQTKSIGVGCGGGVGGSSSTLTGSGSVLGIGIGGLRTPGSSLNQDKNQQEQQQQQQQQTPQQLAQSLENGNEMVNR